MLRFLALRRSARYKGALVGCHRFRLPSKNMPLEPTTPLAKKARAIERDVFGALIGTLVAVVFSRLVALGIDINLYVLMAAVFIGAWSGAFIVHFGSARSQSALASMKSVADRYRAFCLKTMLWMLGAAAVLGVLSVLTGSFDLVGRVAGTTAATAIAAGFLWPFLALLDEQKNWRVGLLGAASVLGAYLMAIPAIWEIGVGWEETALTSLVIVLMMPVGLLAMQITHLSVARVAGTVAALIYLSALSCFLFAIWDNSWRNADELTGTGFTLLGFGWLGVGSLVGAATGDRRYWRWLGVAAAVLVTLMFLQGIWTRNHFPHEWIITVASVAVVIGHANLSLYAPLAGAQIWWRNGTIAAVTATAVALDLDQLLGTSRGGISILGRISLASGILASAGTLGMLVLSRLNRNLDTPKTIDGETAINLQCPRCGKRVAIPVGGAACPKCGLKIRIEIEEM